MNYWNRVYCIIEEFCKKWLEEEMWCEIKKSRMQEKAVLENRTYSLVSTVKWMYWVTMSLMILRNFNLSWINLKYVSMFENYLLIVRLVIDNLMRK